MHEHGPGLPDTVYAVRRLILDGGIPPAVNVHHVVRRGEIHAVSHSPQAAQGNLSPAVVEAIDASLSLVRRHGPVEPDPGHLALLDRSLYQIQRLEEMAKDDDLFLAGQDLVQAIQHQVELFRAPTEGFCLPGDQGRVIADLFEPGEHRENGGEADLRASRQ